MPDVNDQQQSNQQGRYAGATPGFGTYGGMQTNQSQVEQQINELRSTIHRFSSPTAQAVGKAALDQLETCWLIESQGGVLGQQGSFRQQPR